PERRWRFWWWWRGWAGDMVVGDDGTPVELDMLFCRVYTGLPALSRSISPSSANSLSADRNL
ncbi:hypothetical protein B296_00035406, partial [Ensete ventricosum]